jgi:hypothetical protein
MISKMFDSMLGKSVLFSKYVKTIEDVVKIMNEYKTTIANLKQVCDVLKNTTEEVEKVRIMCEYLLSKEGKFVDNKKIKNNN